MLIAVIWSQIINATYHFLTRVSFVLPCLISFKLKFYWRFSANTFSFLEDLYKILDFMIFWNVKVIFDMHEGTCETFSFFNTTRNKCLLEMAIISLTAKFLKYSFFKYNFYIFLKTLFGLYVVGVYKEKYEVLHYVYIIEISEISEKLK